MNPSKDLLKSFLLKGGLWEVSTATLHEKNVTPQNMTSNARVL